MSPTTYTDVLARNIRAARSRLGLSQADVVERMRALGFTAWHKPTLGNVERAQRRVQTEEILGLAACLETTTQRLMMPLWEDKWVQFPSGMAVRVGAVVGLVGGMTAHDHVPNDLGWHKNTPVRTIISPHEIEQQERHDAQRGAEVGARRDAATREIEAQPVVAAIVTSGLGVLVGRRNDGKPPWTFIAGEPEPGERPEDTAIREVKEETGLRIQAGEVIGERVHSKTGRTVIYMAAAPTHGTDAFVADRDELAEVRWVSLDEADELLPGMYEPVREHLARELREPGEF